MQRVYVQCDNSVDGSVSLHDTIGHRPYPAQPAGPRAVRMHPVSPPRGVERHRPRSGANRVAIMIERDEGEMLFHRFGHHHAANGHPTVRQHRGGTVCGTCLTGPQHHTAGYRKTPGAPTPSVLAFSHLWWIPELDQTVAKR